MLPSLILSGLNNCLAISLDFLRSTPSKLPIPHGRGVHNGEGKKPILFFGKRFFEADK